jgi:hypothetical protein
VSAEPPILAHGHMDAMARRRAHPTGRRTYSPCYAEQPSDLVSLGMGHCPVGT